MKRKMPNCAAVWKRLDDFVVPNLALNTIDRATYCYLLRHSRLEGLRRLCFSLSWAARGIRVCHNTARTAIHRLVTRGALRLIRRSRSGHLVEVLLPHEIRAASPHRGDPAESSHSDDALPAGLPEIDQLDFYRTDSLRKTIYARERGLCFYCLRRVNRAVRCLDHVVAQAHSGDNSYRNVVACCTQCNSYKAETPAADFLCKLYRERRLTARQLASRLRALEAVTAGTLRPRMARASKPPRRKRRTAVIPCTD